MAARIATSTEAAASRRRDRPEGGRRVAELGSVWWEPAPAQIGSDPILVAGTSPDGAKAVTVLLCAEGRAFATLEFGSAAGDPVSSEFALDIGGKQYQDIKSGLGG